MPVLDSREVQQPTISAKYDTATKKWAYCASRHFPKKCDFWVAKGLRIDPTDAFYDDTLSFSLWSGISSSQSRSTSGLGIPKVREPLRVQVDSPDLRFKFTEGFERVPEDPKLLDSGVRLQSELAARYRKRETAVSLRDLVINELLAEDESVEECGGDASRHKTLPNLVCDIRSDESNVLVFTAFSADQLVPAKETRRISARLRSVSVQNHARIGLLVYRKTALPTALMQGSRQDVARAIARAYLERVDLLLSLEALRLPPSERVLTDIEIELELTIGCSGSLFISIRDASCDVFESTGVDFSGDGAEGSRAAPARNILPEQPPRILLLQDARSLTVGDYPLPPTDDRFLRFCAAQLPALHMGDFAKHVYECLLIVLAQELADHEPTVYFAGSWERHTFVPGSDYDIHIATAKKVGKSHHKRFSKVFQQELVAKMALATATDTSSTSVSFEVKHFCICVQSQPRVGGDSLDPVVEIVFLNRDFGQNMDIVKLPQIRRANSHKAADGDLRGHFRGHVQMQNVARLLKFQSQKLKPSQRMKSLYLEHLILHVMDKHELIIDQCPPDCASAKSQKAEGLSAEDKLEKCGGAKLDPCGRRLYQLVVEELALGPNSAILQLFLEDARRHDEQYPDFPALHKQYERVVAKNAQLFVRLRSRISLDGCAAHRLESYPPFIPPETRLKLCVKDPSLEFVPEDADALCALERVTRQRQMFVSPAQQCYTPVSLESSFVPEKGAVSVPSRFPQNARDVLVQLVREEPVAEDGTPIGWTAEHFHRRLIWEFPNVTKNWVKHTVKHVRKNVKREQVGEQRERLRRWLGLSERGEPQNSSKSGAGKPPFNFGGAGSECSAVPLAAAHKSQKLLPAVPAAIRIGTNVSVRNLQQQPQLNGRSGVVIALPTSASSNRYGVKVDERKLAIRRENLDISASTTEQLRLSPDGRIVFFPEEKPEHRREFEVLHYMKKREYDLPLEDAGCFPRVCSVLCEARKQGEEGGTGSGEASRRGSEIGQAKATAPEDWGYRQCVHVLDGYSEGSAESEDETLDCWESASEKPDDVSNSDVRVGGLNWSVNFWYDFL